MEFWDMLRQHLAREKIFLQNPTVTWQMNYAVANAKILFDDVEINIEDDPLQMGGLCLLICTNDFKVREIDRFKEIIKFADNFEIYPKGNKIVLAMFFGKALVRITPVQGK